MVVQIIVKFISCIKNNNNKINKSLKNEKWYIGDAKICKAPNA